MSHLGWQVRKGVTAVLSHASVLHKRSFTVCVCVCARQFVDSFSLFVCLIWERMKCFVNCHCGSEWIVVFTVFPPEWTTRGREWVLQIHIGTKKMYILRGDPLWCFTARICCWCSSVYLQLLGLRLTGSNKRTNKPDALQGDQLHLSWGVRSIAHWAMTMYRWPDKRRGCTRCSSVIELTGEVVGFFLPSKSERINL